MLFVATMLFLALINQMELRPRKLTPGNWREVFCNRTPEGRKGKRMDQRFALKNDWMIGLRFYSQRHKAFSRIYAGIFQLFPGQDKSWINLQENSIYFLSYVGTRFSSFFFVIGQEKAAHTY